MQISKQEALTRQTRWSNVTVFQSKQWYLAKVIISFHIAKIRAVIVIRLGRIVSLLTRIGGAMKEETRNEKGMYEFTAWGLSSRAFVWPQTFIQAQRLP